MATVTAKILYTPQVYTYPDVVVVCQEWSLSVFRSVEDVMQLVSIECKLVLRAIYAKVKFVG